MKRFLLMLMCVLALLPYPAAAYKPKPPGDPALAARFGEILKRNIIEREMRNQVGHGKSRRRG